MSVQLDMHLSQRQTVMGVATVALGIALGVAAFAWTSHLSESGQLVAGGVDFVGTDISGYTRQQVRTVVAANATEALTHPIEIDIDEEDVAYIPSDIGFHYDQSATVATIMEARRTGGPLSQFWSWLISPISTVALDPDWTFDGEEARLHLGGSASLTPRYAVEPRFNTDNRGRLVMKVGKAGTTVDLDDLIDQFGTINLTRPPDHVRAALIDQPPTVGDAAAQQEIDRWTEMTASGIRVSVNGRAVRLSPEHLRSRLRLVAHDGDVAASFDLAKLQEGIESHFPEPVLPMTKPEFLVRDGEFTLVEEGHPPQVCCRANAAAVVADVILSGHSTPFATVQLQARKVDDPLLDVYADGSLITEEVSSFTTPHLCCESRVTNIHRFADIVNGAYVLPGEILSLNAFVGPRTLENGFVPAGAIRSGHLTDEVGGGVSQFATTFFNASFFAGLDFVEYQSHSIYFSRYPYGREATISTPGPDLAIKNTTDYPILIGTSYTDTSITVSMYSTKNVLVEQVEQRQSSQNLCTHVETDRQRAYLDGHTVIDTVYADYRPEDGIDCNGDPIPIDTEL